MGTTAQSPIVHAMGPAKSAKLLAFIVAAFWIGPACGVKPFFYCFLRFQATFLGRLHRFTCVGSGGAGFEKQGRLAVAIKDGGGMFGTCPNHLSVTRSFPDLVWTREGAVLSTFITPCPLAFSC